MSSFALKPPDEFNIFKSTDPQSSKYDIANIGVDNLQHFKDHPFQLYTGERFTDMMESVKHNGILIPLIIRPLENDSYNYEILSGHNRYEAGKAAGLETVPCIIKEDLTDEEALLIVFETNLRQRSFLDFSHSERASILATHYGAMKQQGKRTDLINEIEDMLAVNESEQSSESKWTDKAIGEEYGLSKDMIARYIRVNGLVQGLKDLADKESLSISTAAVLSYLKESDQEAVQAYASDNNQKITMNHAGQFRVLSQKNRLTNEAIADIFQGKRAVKKDKPKNIIQVKRKSIQSFFPDNESEAEIENTIIKALSFYFENKDSLLLDEMPETNT